MGTTATTTGTNLSDYNLFENNEITGGYYGITSVGSTTSAVGNNAMVRNTIKDFYAYGIYLSGNFNALVEKNNIFRPARTASTTTYGIYVTSLNTGVKLSKNRIHNLFDGAPTACLLYTSREILQLLIHALYRIFMKEAGCNFCTGLPN